MENLVEELKKVVRFKEETEAGDIVLVAIDTPRSLLYARVREFERDDSRKDEWWHVSMQLLTVPIQEVVWTLRREQFTGQEIFTMGGGKRFIQAVDMDVPIDNVPFDDDSDKGPDKKDKPRLQRIK